MGGTSISTARLEQRWSGTRDSNLGGCVQDVGNAYDIVVRLGVSPKHIKQLRASVGKGVNRPMEEKSVWSTRENIERDLDWIKQQAGKGDFVYFHYSG